MRAAAISLSLLALLLLPATHGAVNGKEIEASRAGAPAARSESHGWLSIERASRISAGQHVMVTAVHYIPQEELRRWWANCQQQHDSSECMSRMMRIRQSLTMQRNPHHI